ncbi:hypothetical protein [Pseudomonas sp. TWR3-1-1]|uniref:hypothetical protein n=1 Tax=Pseudomonas sp. TWR3-1-1 TaxID=2804633 RepID=UPI003CF72931
MIVIQKQGDCAVLAGKCLAQRMQGALRLNIQCLRSGQMRQVRQFNTRMVKGQNQVGKKAVRFAIGLIQ